ncbi:uncharacterized protein [Gossypium hirsutum]|uniref:RNA-directed DNA polymerase homolog n=1 Tax=Gossypium hirsutum TaxID=3635 RepID=A0A1U8ISL0_GOSHI|nr:uncharacterized protein LOC107899860 [Gossypium hirsutum]
MCQHKIRLEEGKKLVIDAQCRLNPAMKKVVKKELLKCLDAGIVYAISNSEWVNPTQCVPKERGLTVVENDKNELIPWLESLYRGKIIIVSLTDTRDIIKSQYIRMTRKKPSSHVLFVPMLSNECRLDLVMPPTTFLRCMTAIFSYMLEKGLDVLMDDFSVYEDSFQECLDNLEQALPRCKETNLMLDWKNVILWSKKD